MCRQRGAARAWWAQAGEGSLCGRRTEKEMTGEGHRHPRLLHSSSSAGTEGARFAGARRGQRWEECGQWARPDYTAPVQSTQNHPISGRVCALTLVGSLIIRRMKRARKESLGHWGPRKCSPPCPPGLPHGTTPAGELNSRRHGQTKASKVTASSTTTSTPWTFRGSPPAPPCLKCSRENVLKHSAKLLGEHSRIENSQFRTFLAFCLQTVPQGRKGKEGKAFR